MPHDDIFEMVELMDGWGCSICLLYELESLTKLVLNVQREAIEVTFWKSLAHLTGLKDLHMIELDIPEFGDIICLTSCQELTSLRVYYDDDSPVPFFDMKVRTGSQVKRAANHPCLGVCSISHAWLDNQMKP
jgi:hypothetical protein